MIIGQLLTNEDVDALRWYLNVRWWEYLLAEYSGIG